VVCDGQGTGVSRSQPERRKGTEGVQTPEGAAHPLREGNVLVRKSTPRRRDKRKPARKGQQAKRKGGLGQSTGDNAAIKEPGSR